MHKHEHTFYREEGNEETAVTVEFTMTPRVAATYWDPPEGGEIEIQRVFTEADGWAAKWSDAEDETWTLWLAENFEDDDYDGGYD